MEEKRAPEKMTEFILSKIDPEDQKTAALIGPLPASVLPSQQFLLQTRLWLLSASSSSSEQRAA